MRPEGGGMSYRRLVGIDLGIATAHTVRVLDGEGAVVCQAQGLADGGKPVRGGGGGAGRMPGGHQAGGGDRADRAGVAADRGVLLRPRAPGVPGLVAEGGRPAPVLVPARQEQRDRRRTRWPGCRWSTRPGCGRWSCPAPRRPRWTGGSGPPTGSPRPAPSTRCRIKDLVRQLLPVTPLTGELGVADLAVLERYADPHALIRLGMTRLTALITKASLHQYHADVILCLRNVAFGRQPPCPMPWS